MRLRADCQAHSVLFWSTTINTIIAALLATVGLGFMLDHVVHWGELWWQNIDNNNKDCPLNILPTLILLTF